MTKILNAHARSPRRSPQSEVPNPYQILPSEGQEIGKKGYLRCLKKEARAAAKDLALMPVIFTTVVEDDNNIVEVGVGVVIAIAAGVVPSIVSVARLVAAPLTAAYAHSKKGFVDPQTGKVPHQPFSQLSGTWIDRQQKDRYADKREEYNDKREAHQNAKVQLNNFSNFFRPKEL